MEKAVRIFKNFEEAEKAERDYYLRLTPEERLDILETLRQRYQELHGDKQGFRRVFRVVKQT